MADDAPPPPDADEPRPCPPCRGTGRVVSRLGGSAATVTCPWCEGTGRVLPGHDAQAARRGDGTHPPSVAVGLFVPSGAMAASSLAHSSVQATGPGGRPLIKQGDEITIYETLVNNGSTAATGITGTLTTTTPGITVTSGTSRYPDLAPDPTGRNVTAFTAQLDPDVPCGRLIP